MEHTDEKPADGRGEIPAAAEAPKPSQDYADVILNTMMDEIAIIDVRDFTIVDANRALLEAYGLKHAEVLGQTCHCLTHGMETPCDDGHGCCPIREMVRTGAPAVCEHEHIGPRGEPKFVSISVSPIRDATGTIVRAVHAVRDITAHKRGLETLAMTEARFRAMIDNFPFLVWLKDTEGRFVAVNRTFARSCGRRHPGEVVGRTDLDVWPRDLAERYRADDMEVMRSGQQKYAQELIADKGVDTWFETFKLPVYDGVGKLLGTTGFSRDITRRRAEEEERRRLEAQFQQAQKMEAVGQLAGGVAHDFNNLLSVIISYTGFALDDIPPENPMRADLLEVRKAGERAAGLTRQLLAFSRKQVIEPRTISPNDALNDLTKMLTRLIGENITLDLHLAPETRDITMDPTQFDQVLTNIAVNARDAMPHGGRLVIETRNATLDAEEARSRPDVAPGDYVVISISDTGTGIPKDVLPKIFEPFFTTKERGKGTGLGLSMVYGAVKQNGGHLVVFSEVGKGTTFKVFIPSASPAADATISADSLSAAQGRGETVLVVEDDGAVRRSLVRTLQAAGYLVIEAGSGAEALSLFGDSGGTIALVLTDVVMPEMSGPMLAIELERRRPGVKVLYCSGYTDDTLTMQGLVQAGTRLISKPVERQALLRKVREILDEKG